MSRLIYASAQARRLPSWFAWLDGRGLPKRAILSLGSIVVLLTGVGAIFPDLLVNAFTVASSVFIAIYLLCLVSYLRLTQGYGKRLIYSALFVFFCATLSSVGLKVFYPIAVFLLALLASFLRERWHTAHQEAEGGAEVLQKA